MAGSYSITRISQSELGDVRQSDFHIIGAITRDQEVETVEEDPRSGTYVEVKPDRRLPPFVKHDRPAPNVETNILLVEVEAPDDSDTIQRLKDELGVYQPRMSQP